MVLVASIPVNYVLGFYRRWTSALDPAQADPQTWHRDEHRAEIRPSAHRAYASEASGDARPAAPRDMSTGSVKQTRSTFVRSDSSTPTPKIWHPPASAYAEDIALNPHSGLPTPSMSMSAVKTRASSLPWTQVAILPPLSRYFAMVKLRCYSLAYTPQVFMHHSVRFPQVSGPEPSQTSWMTATIYRPLSSAIYPRVTSGACRDIIAFVEKRRSCA